MSACLLSNECVSALLPFVKFKSVETSVQYGAVYMNTEEKANVVILIGSLESVCGGVVSLDLLRVCVGG